MGNYIVPPYAKENNTIPAYVAHLLVDDGYRFFYNNDTNTYIFRKHGSDFRDVEYYSEEKLINWASTRGIDASTVKQAVDLLANLNRISLIRYTLLGLEWYGENAVADICDALIKPYEILSLQLDEDPEGYIEIGASPYPVLKAWMLGAVGKALGGEPSPLLVVEGNPGIGKRALIHWLCSGITSIFKYGDIDLTDAKSVYNAQRYFIWDITNLDLIKGYDAEAFVDFITRTEGVTEASATPCKINASFITTTRLLQKLEFLNARNKDCPEVLFMPLGVLLPFWKIPTRFMEYTDPKQAWAEAVARWYAGERWYTVLTEKDREANRRLWEIHRKGNRS